MKLEEYTKRAKTPEADAWREQEAAARAPSELVVAATILASGKGFCRIDVNGRKYDVDPRDVIEIEEIPVPETPETKEAAEEKGPPTVLLKLNRNAVLFQLTPVQAALLAAAGTWMWVSAPAPEQAGGEKEGAGKKAAGKKAAGKSA